MVDTKTVLAELHTIKRAISNVVQMTGYAEYGDMSEVSIECETEDFFLRDEFNLIIDKLADMQARIEYLMLPVVETSTLSRNSRDRFETPSGYELTCGCGIEYLHTAEDENDHTKWCRSSVEHNGKDYYIVGERDLSLSGLLVRIRRSF